MGDPRARSRCGFCTGVGSVGSQMLTGIAHLERWRQQDPSSFAVWPFESSDARIVVSETWPSHSVFAAAQQSVRDQRPSAVRDEVQTQGTAAVLQSAAASEALMDLGRLRQEVMATPQGPGGWRLSPEVRAQRFPHITTSEGGWILLLPTKRTTPD